MRRLHTVFGWIPYTKTCNDATHAVQLNYNNLCSRIWPGFSWKQFARQTWLLEVFSHKFLPPTVNCELKLHIVTSISLWNISNEIKAIFIYVLWTLWVDITALQMATCVWMCANAHKRKRMFGIPELIHGKHYECKTSIIDCTNSRGQIHSLF